MADLVTEYSPRSLAEPTNSTLPGSLATQYPPWVQIEYLPSLSPESSVTEGHSLEHWSPAALTGRRWKKGIGLALVKPPEFARLLACSTVMETRSVYELPVSIPPRWCYSDDWGSFCELPLRDAVDKLLQGWIDRESDCYPRYFEAKMLMEKKIDVAE